MSPAPARNWKSWLFDIALVLAMALYAAGLFGPLFTVRQLLIFTDTVSIASSLAQLLEQGYPVLFLLILLFSVLVPLLKFAVLARLRWRSASRTGASRWLRWLEQLAKWSMLDVLVVAMLVVSIKLNLIVDVRVHYGLYAFASSVLLTMVLVPWVTAANMRSAEIAASGPLEI